ncbi:hypothetical protein VNO77_39264 [Canavalia gladiata]|uniref:Gnk2-homologous domain-containing protein n=1 Tax=Canavalia gladiata TaxID=3824 RepID=A0AAN9KCC2_CANGL
MIMRTPLNKRSISFAFLLLLSFKPLIKAQQTPIFLGSNCQNSTHKPLSRAYQTNLEDILTWLSTDAVTSKGYNHSSISSNIHGDDAVYGLYECRGDVVGYFCQFCVSYAAKEIPQQCPNGVSAMIWYDFCVLRYSNENFIGKAQTYPSWHAFGIKNISNSEEIQKAEDFIRYLIKKATKETNQLFYMDGFNLSSTERRYGMVQCTRDLSNEVCRECLEAILAQFPKCCEQKLRWSIWSESCLIKYHDQIFYLLNNQAPLVSVPNLHIANQGGGNRRSKNLIIGLSVMGSIALLCFSVYCFWYRNRVKKDGLTTDIVPSSFHNVQTEETLNTDLPMIPLITILQSTDNFSEASKLGEGGFGPVYKAWKMWCAGKCLELMDPVVEKSLIGNEAVKCIQIDLVRVITLSQISNISYFGPTLRRRILSGDLRHCR